MYLGKKYHSHGVYESGSFLWKVVVESFFVGGKFDLWRGHSLAYLWPGCIFRKNKRAKISWTFSYTLQMILPPKCRFNPLFAACLDGMMWDGLSEVVIAAAFWVSPPSSPFRAFCSRLVLTMAKFARTAAAGDAGKPEAFPVRPLRGVLLPHCGRLGGAWQRRRGFRRFLTCLDPLKFAVV